MFLPSCCLLLLVLVDCRGSARRLWWQPAEPHHLDKVIAGSPKLPAGAKNSQIWCPCRLQRLKRHGREECHRWVHRRHPAGTDPYIWQRVFTISNLFWTIYKNWFKFLILGCFGVVLRCYLVWKVQSPQMDGLMWTGHLIGHKPIVHKAARFDFCYLATSGSHTLSWDETNMHHQQSKTAYHGRAHCSIALNLGCGEIGLKVRACVHCRHHTLSAPLAKIPLKLELLEEGLWLKVLAIYVYVIAGLDDQGWEYRSPIYR